MPDEPKRSMLFIPPKLSIPATEKKIKININATPTLRLEYFQSFLKNCTYLPLLLHLLLLPYDLPCCQSPFHPFLQRRYVMMTMDLTGPYSQLSKHTIKEITSRTHVAHSSTTSVQLASIKRLTARSKTHANTTKSTLKKKRKEKLQLEVHQFQFFQPILI